MGLDAFMGHELTSVPHGASGSKPFHSVPASRAFVLSVQGKGSGVESMRILKYSDKTGVLKVVNLGKLPVEHMTGIRVTESQMKARIVRQGFKLVGKRQK